MSEAAERVNLSYVVHEPSTSQPVTIQLGAMRRARRRMDDAERRLGRLVPLAIAARTLVLAPAGEPPRGAPGAALTVQVGPWRLLSRVLTARYGSGEEAPWEARLLDDPRCLDARPVAFFRGPARLCLPAEQALPAWFAALVLRPGGNDLLLELTPLDGPDRADRATQAAEAAIRTHVGQWTCSAALWSRPAEQELPEFLAG